MHKGVKQMKRLLLILATVVIVFLITVPPAGAEMMDTLLPQDTDQKTEGNVTLEYNEYKLSRYGMDTQLKESESSDLLPWGWDDGVKKQMDQSLSILNSTIWGINKIFADIVGILVSESYNYDVIADFSTQIGKTIQEIAGFGPGGFTANGIWPYLVAFMICITAIWAAYVGIVKRATSHALGGFLKSVLIMAVSFGFFTNAGGLLNTINEGVSEIQNDILSISISATTPGNFNENEGIATMRNQIFNLMVKYPWLLMEFGTVDENSIGEERIDALLSNNAFSQERLDAVTAEVEEHENENMKPESQTDRFIILLLTLLMNAIMGVIILLLSGSLILYQILVLVFSIFAPFALLIGLIPAFSNTAKNVLTKLGHAFYMKIAIAFLMTLYFSISSMVYNTMNPQEGYVLLFIIQIICTVAVWVKRNDILNVITTPFRQSGLASNTGQSINEYKQSYFKGKKYFNTLAKPFTTPAKPLEQRASYQLKYKPGVGVANPIRHPMYNQKTKEQKVNPVQTQPVKNQVNPVQTQPNKNQVKTVKPNIDQQPSTTRKPLQETKVPTMPTYQSPKLRNQENFDSLSRTLEKGGHAHRVKEDTAPIQLKKREDIEKAINNNKEQQK